jgi:hypothetical protein
MLMLLLPPLQAGSSENKSSKIDGTKIPEIFLPRVSKYIIAFYKLSEKTE